MRLQHNVETTESDPVKSGSIHTTCRLDLCKTSPLQDHNRGIPGTFFASALACLGAHMGYLDGGLEHFGCTLHNTLLPQPSSPYVFGHLGLRA